MTSVRSGGFRALLPAAVDLLLVLVFVLIGRGFHAEALDPAGLLETGWPFVAGLALAWAVTRAWRAPWRVVRPGIGIWIVTVAAAMMLRLVSGQGTQLSFVLVTAVVLAAFLIGWRAVAGLARRGATGGSPAH